MEAFTSTLTIFRHAGKFAMRIESNSLLRCAQWSLIILLLGSSSISALAQAPYTEKPGTEGNGDIIIGPDYQIDPELTDRGNPKGKYFEFSMRLEDSKIF